MVKRVTMVMGNKILCRVTELPQTSGMEKELKKETIK